MRRSTQVRLVLMGGGIIASAVVPLILAPDCSQPAEHDSSCTSNTSSRTGSSSFSHFGHGGSTAAGLAAGAAAGAAAATDMLTSLLAFLTCFGAAVLPMPRYGSCAACPT